MHNAHRSIKQTVKVHGLMFPYDDIREVVKYGQVVITRKTVSLTLHVSVIYHPRILLGWLAGVPSIREACMITCEPSEPRGRVNARLWPPSGDVL